MFVRVFLCFVIVLCLNFAVRAGMSRVNSILISLVCHALAVRQVANVHSVKNGRLLLGVRP